MGASVVPSPAITTGPSDNWVLISSSNPNTTTLNFTGISGYKKLMVHFQGTGGSPGRNLSSLRFNSDSGSKYSYVGTKSQSTSPYIADDITALTTSALPSAGANVNYLKVIIDSCDNTNLKTYQYFPDGSSTGARQGTGFYQATAAITSVNLTWDNNYNSTVYLYGVLA